MCCMPVLRNQLGQWVYPVHRLDRGTSGVVLFALRPEIARTLGAAFSARQIKKEYLAVARGYLPDKGRIHHAYCPPNKSSPVEAITDFHCKGTVELPYPVGRYKTARYSLMRAMPVTGRQHQIRRHCAHLRHPIIGDVRYGDRHHNRFFQSHFEIRPIATNGYPHRFCTPHIGNMDRNLRANPWPHSALMPAIWLGI